MGQEFDGMTEQVKNGDINRRDFLKHALAAGLSMAPAQALLVAQSRGVDFSEGGVK